MNEVVEACKEGRVDDVQQLLEDEETALDPRLKDDNGWTLLHHASQHGHKPVVEYLLSRGCDPYSEASDRATPLHLACAHERVDVAMCLLQALPPGAPRKTRDGNTPLHFACKAGSVPVIQAILERAQERGGAYCSLPNQKGVTPIGIAISAIAQASAANEEFTPKHYEVANLLLDRMTGNPARIKDLQGLFQSFNSKLSLGRYGRVIIVGDHRTGKSTIAKTIQEESTMRNALRGYAMPGTLIQDVDQHRVGLVPSDIVSQSMDSRVILYDLAPSRAFIHENLIESTDDIANSVFIVCIDMKEEDKKEIRAKLLYWFRFIHHQCIHYMTTQNKPNVVVVGRSFDMPRPRSVPDSRRLTNEYSDIESNDEISQNLNLLQKFSMDFRKHGSVGLSDLRTLIKKRFQILQASEGEGDAASRLYILSTVLESEFPDSPAIQVRDLQAKLSEDSPQNSLLALLPQALEELLQLCRKLEERRRVLLVKEQEDSSAEDTWIVHNHHQLLTDMNDALCPPGTDPTESLALMSREDLQQCLSRIPVSFDVLLQMMSYYRVSVPVAIKEPSADQLYYTPALLPREQDLPSWNEDGFLKFALAVVPPSNPYLEFFMPRFLNFLLLRLLNFSKAEQLENCSVWAEGICFNNAQGTIEVCIVVNAQGVILNMRCKNDQEIECLVLRNRILETIRGTKEDYQPDTVTEELLLPSPPNDNFPLKDAHSPKLSKLSTQELKKRILEEPESITTELVPFFEPYSHLCNLPHGARLSLTDTVQANQQASTEVMAALQECFGLERLKSLTQYFELALLDTHQDVSTASTETPETESKDEKGAALLPTYGHLLECFASVSIFECSTLKWALKDTMVTTKQQLHSSASTPTSSEPDIDGSLPTTDTSSSSSSAASQPSMDAAEPNHSNHERVLSATPKHETFQTIEQTQVVCVDSKGGRFSYEPHKVELIIPEGSTQSPVNIEVGVTIQGSFTYAKNIKPISPIVMVWVEEGSPLSKPVDLVLPHSFGFDNDSQLLSFYQAGKRRRQTDRPSFQKAKGDADIRRGKGTLRIKLKSGPQFFCIGCKTTSEAIAKMSYCVMKVVPKSTNEVTWKLKLYVSYRLPTCIEMVRGRYGPDHIVSCFDFRFQVDGKPNPSMTLDYEPFLGDSQPEWALTVDGQHAIGPRDVDFSDDEVQSLVCHGHYPPRFNMTINGDRAQSRRIAEIEFEGVQRQLAVQVDLMPSTTNLISRSAPNGREQLSNRHQSVSSSHNSIRSADPSNHGLHMSSPMMHHSHPELNTLPEATEAEMTDIELDQLGNKIIRKLPDDWVCLRFYLGIEEADFRDVKERPTVRQQIFHMLWRWREQDSGNNRKELSRHLVRVDSSLRGIAQQLRNRQIIS